MTGARLTCRFCAWSTPQWTTRRDGKHTHGYQRLKDHVEYAHHAEYAAIITQVLREEDSATESFGEETARGGGL